MSYTSLTYHIVFSTKDRQPQLVPELLPRLVKYLGGIIRSQEGQMIEANGPEDHIHIVASMTPKFALADCLRDFKANSSGWIHDTFSSLRDFAWQEGYAAFTVSQSAVPKVVEYVRNQQQHHRKMTFREELIALLKRHGIKYDEKYIA